MSSFTLCAEMVWKIENYYYCWHEKGQALFSPVVCVESLEESKWRLQLYPRGRDDTDVLSLFLWRMEDTFEISDISIRYEFAVLGVEDSPFKSTIKTFVNVFKQDTAFGCPTFLNRSLLCEKKQDYLGDVLTIRCKIQSENTKSSEPIFFLRTHIPIYECIFPWYANEAFEPKKESTISLTLPFKTDQTASVDLQQVCDQNKKHVEVIISGDIKKECSWKCDIRFSETEEVFLICEGKIDPSSLPYEKGFQPLSLFPSKTDGKKSKILRHELNCVFAIVSRDLENCGDARICYNRDKITGNTACAKSKVNANVVDKKRSLHHDVRKMYLDKLLSDFSIKVQDKSLRVHSCILSARSPVLNRMLETNMKESNNKTLELDDLDEKTVTQMLDYMYTDDTGELCTESALKLYYVSDRYDVQGLKEETTIFLESNMSCDNVCSILELSDRHNDERLKSVAIKFILNHGKKMLKSEEFRKFSKRSPDLFSELVFSFDNLNFDI